MSVRRSGILLHPTSLPSPFGIGDLGPEAHRFVDALADCGQCVWQLLPLSPTAVFSHDDPYHSVSAFAGNPLLISLEGLVQDGLLSQAEIESPPALPAGTVDYEAVTRYKHGLFDLAFERFGTRGKDMELERFCSEKAGWLEDYALFSALKKRYGARPWTAWPEGIRDRRPEALAGAAREMAQDVQCVCFLQYVFHRQWNTLRRHSRGRGIQLLGDMPIYVDHDSVEVWAHRRLFRLDGEGLPTAVSGVPPDYFSTTGQLWGTPVYDWEAVQEHDFDWWVARVERNLELYDILRIDHFRGLVAYWEIPAGEETALQGKWVEAPAEDLLERLARRMPCLPLVAEDLGIITPDVREVMARFDLPGMKILLFAFGDDMARNPYIPHNLDRHCVAYTGTHDNNPVLGWFDTEATEEEKERFFAYVGRPVPREEVPREMIRLVQASVADLAIIPVQDLLGLGAEARMNRPGRLEGNWRWRLERPLDADSLLRLREMTRLYGRA